MFTEQLQRLRNELADDDRSRVLDLTDPVMDALEATRTREAAYDKVAQHVRASADGDAHSVADDYLGAVAEAEERRSEAIQTVMRYLSGEVTGETAASAVDDAIDAENRLGDATDALDGAKGDVSVPPILAVTGTETLEIPKGTDASETYTVSNLGTEVAADVTVSVDGDLSLSVSPTAVGRLAPEEEATVTLSGSPTDEGQHNVRLSASSGHVGDVLVVTAVVADKGDYVERARTQVQTLRRTVAGIREDTDGGNGKNGRDKGNGENGLQGVENKLRTIENRLQKAQRQLERGRTPANAVDNQLGAAINELEAVQNQVDGLRPQQISSGDATLVVNDAEKTVTTLEIAQRADP
jgi:hypothetical protein